MAATSTTIEDEAEDVAGTSITIKDKAATSTTIKNVTSTATTMKDVAATATTIESVASAATNNEGVVSTATTGCPLNLSNFQIAVTLLLFGIIPICKKN